MKKLFPVFLLVLFLSGMSHAGEGKKKKKGKPDNPGVKKECIRKKSKSEPGVLEQFKADYDDSREKKKKKKRKKHDNGCRRGQHKCRCGSFWSFLPFWCDCRDTYSGSAVQYSVSVHDSRSGAGPVRRREYAGGTGDGVFAVRRAKISRALENVSFEYTSYDGSSPDDDIGYRAVLDYYEENIPGTLKDRMLMYSFEIMGMYDSGSHYCNLGMGIIGIDDKLGWNINLGLGVRFSGEYSLECMLSPGFIQNNLPFCIFFDDMEYSAGTSLNKVSLDLVYRTDMVNLYCGFYAASGPSVSLPGIRLGMGIRLK